MAKLMGFREDRAISSRVSNLDELQGLVEDATSPEQFSTAVCLVWEIESVVRSCHS